jgi:uncharacterized Fe-S radical SAM superfamily protein PflX
MRVRAPAYLKKYICIFLKKTQISSATAETKIPPKKFGKIRKVRKAEKVKNIKIKGKRPEKGNEKVWKRQTR